MASACAAARQAFGQRPDEGLVLPVVAFVLVRYRLREDRFHLAARIVHGLEQALHVFGGRDAGRIALCVRYFTGVAARPSASRAAARAPAARQAAGAEEAGPACRVLSDDEATVVIIVVAALCR
ncbi:hypothetical protein [Shinella sp. M27]|uniref:hypothetical protein n=1 Tax=Shinella sp. M27 TaxID=3368614 RepID=UPI003BA0C0FC